MDTCECGCGVTLRKDNRTGYQKGHKPCLVCGNLVKKSGLECCSKSCSAKLHWQRNPEMTASRSFNAERFATREKNREEWIKNLSIAKKGNEPWNKGKIGVQEAWNKGLPKIQQPFYGKTHKEEYYLKCEKTILEKYGITNTWSLAKTSPRSKVEKRLQPLLENYSYNVKFGNFKPDYINYDTHHIIEVYGDYWHCNPKKYSKEYYHSQLKMTAEEIWLKDKIRLEYFESMGYSVTIVWENDIDKFIKDYISKHDTENTEMAGSITTKTMPTVGLQ